MAAIFLRKLLAFFPQKLVTSGGNEIQEKNELYRRRSGQQSECRLFRSGPNAANHPDYPGTASSLGERLIEKGLSLSLPVIGPKIDVEPPNFSGDNCIYGRKISFVGVLNGTTVEASPNLRFADFPSD